MENSSYTSIAIFRLPGEDTFYSLRGNSRWLEPNETALPETCFCFSPYNQSDKILCIEGMPENGIGELPGFHLHPNTEKEHTLGKGHYENLVAAAIEQMKNGHFKKVVLANSKGICLDNFQVETFLKKLQQAHPNALVYCFSSAQTGTWFGATPEPLITGNLQEMQSVALAGTRPSTDPEGWHHKEIEEQQLVEYFIARKILEHGFDYKKEGPFDFVSGNLVHLKSVFKIQQVNSHEKLFSFIKDLSPTPAVAGLPRDEAISFIAQNENLNRSFYTGWLGFKNKESYHFYVNLRCMKWHGNAATLFAGAGITADSDPAKEWEETQNKMKALSAFL